MKRTNTGELSRVRVLISGRVQGVNFRASTRAQARMLGVVGSVRNLADGRVEAIFEGPQADVQQLVSWCYKGPSSARIANVEAHWEPPTGHEQAFQIIW